MNALAVDLGQPLPESTLEQFTFYDFASDEIYQQGLASIIANSRLATLSEDELYAETLAARVFYFNKLKGHSLTLDEVQQYESSNLSQNRVQESRNGVDTPSFTDETRVLTLAELREMLDTGKLDQIPNNKHIPVALNRAAPSVSTAPPRKKPWEHEQ